MTQLFLVRHATTAWNRTGRIQGRTDVPLDAGGRAEAATWRLPAALRCCSWVASPLARAVETARALGAPAELATDPRLAEMSWGKWEGWSLTDLRATHGAAMAANEARGLDFRPPGGESPRDVQARIASWLAEVSARGQPILAVTHAGVIRAVLALATGWQMTGKPPVRLSWSAAHGFVLSADGAPRAGRLNISLVPEPVDQDR